VNSGISWRNMPISRHHWELTLFCAPHIREDRTRTKINIRIHCRSPECRASIGDLARCLWVLLGLKHQSAAMTATKLVDLSCPIC
jgi:hypothetical protein